MNRFFYGFLAFLFLFLSIYPFSNVFADNDLVITGTPIPVQGEITDDQLKDIIVAGITADLVSQGYSIDLSASDGNWDNFKNSILDYIFNQAASGSGFWGEIYNSALYHNLIDENFTLWYPDTSDDSILPGISKRSIYRNLSDCLVNNIIEHRSDDSTPTPTPNPDPNYTQYLDIINGTGFFFKDWNNGYRNNVYNADTDEYYTYYFQKYFPNYNYSWFIARDNNQFDSTGDNGALVCCGPIYDINIFSIGDNLYQYSITPTIYSDAFTYQNEVGHYYRSGQIATNWSAWDFTGNTIFGTTQSNLNGNWTGSLTGQGSLLGIFTNVLTKKCRNVNIYVDGVPWSIVGETSQVLPTVIINPGYVLQGTDFPLIYNFPDPPSFDYQRMIDIIKHALLQYGVIQWEDIADVFVDVNGQTAVAVLSIHRNDYDVLYDEQYPGIALPNRFNTHLLDSSHNYLSPVVQSVEETTGILPGEIKGALAIGMMLTIFACLIHRLLE